GAATRSSRAASSPSGSFRSGARSEGPRMTRLHLALALLSAALIAFELVLMRLLSTVQWHHYAYMVISVALLGFGASGTLLTFARTWLLRRLDVVLPVLMVCCGAAMAVVVAGMQLPGVRFDAYLLFVDAAQRRA